MSKLNEEKKKAGLKGQLKRKKNEHKDGLGSLEKTKTTKKVLRIDPTRKNEREGRKGGRERGQLELRPPPSSTTELTLWSELSTAEVLES